MVPMTIGASIPSNDPLAFWPSPAYLPTAPASAVWSRPPSSDESICDPFSMSEDWPESPIILAKLPRAPVCCLTTSTSFCGPPGCAATPLRPASSPGTAAPIAVCVLLRSRPSADATDHIGRQELQNERDEIDGHGFSSSLSSNLGRRRNERATNDRAGHREHLAFSTIARPI